MACRPLKRSNWPASVGRWGGDGIELGIRGAHQGPARDVDDRGELQVGGVDEREEVGGARVSFWNSRSTQYDALCIRLAWEYMFW